MRKPSQVTLEDIAKRLDVSKVTVSKALRDHPDIATDTKARIKKLAKELDYTPNYIARDLSAKKTNTIGLVVPKIAHAFFASVIEAIYDTAFANNFEIILTVSQENAEREIGHIKTLLSMRVGGLLVSLSEQTPDTAIFKLVKKKNVPLVFFDRVLEGCDFSTVTADDRGGAVLAVEQAIRAGYTKIAHLAGFSHLNIGRERGAGFRQAMQKHNLPINPEWIIEGGLGEEYGYKGLMQWYNIQNLPEVIFAVTFPVALGVYQATKELGLRIPQDIDLICFGDSNICRFLSPPLTCIEQPTDKLGKKAVELLIQEMNRSDFSTPQQIVLETSLKIRQTCLSKRSL
jgi:LacI family transcriptional regulator